MSGDRREDYAVGYGKPPRHSQFQKGQSGNPTGKRKGLRSSIRQVEKFLETPLVVNEGGRRSRKTPFEITLLKVLQEVTNGNMQAAKLILELQRQVDERKGAADQQRVDYTDAIPRFLALIERQGLARQEGQPDG